MTILEVIRFDSLAVSRWQNGAGRKADIAGAPGWHVGFAWLDADAPFSDFSGRDRTITLVDGPGFTLDFTGHPALHVSERFRPASFDGGWPTQCRLQGGPGLVLNAMTERSRFRHTVEVVEADAMRIARGDAAAAFLILLTGTATAPGVSLQPKDAVAVQEPITLAASAGALACRIAVLPA